jgi:hypothetical protein
MGHTGIYVPTLLELTYKAGANVAVAAIAEAFANSYIAQAESLINCACRKVFAVDTAAFTALPATTKQLLTEVASNIAAIYAIQYDMSGFTSRVEAEDMINILRDGALRGLSILRDKKAQQFLMTGTI